MLAGDSNINLKSEDEDSAESVEEADILDDADDFSKK